jgi:ATP-dependent Zn protease
MNPLPRLIKLAQTVSNFAYRLLARFRGLSKRAQRIIVAQAIILVLVFGAVSRNVYVKTTSAASFSGGSRRSIEVSYSSFMDLVEEQPPLRTLNQSPGKPILGPKRSEGGLAGSMPVMDNVRIGSDRIVYQLRRPPATAATPLLESTTAGAPAKRSLLSRPRQQQQRRPDYVTAYTRKVSASPELVQLLRKNGISFSAAAQPSASVLALTVRSFLVTFYFLILWRLYQTVSGAGGGGSGKDAPGKLAQASELPLASFDDIQGIDESKQEVMELVDTLRNPEKYAILGARAPTGLLLEGTLCGVDFPACS